MGTGTTYLPTLGDLLSRLPSVRSTHLWENFRTTQRIHLEGKHTKKKSKVTLVPEIKELKGDHRVIGSVPMHNQVVVNVVFLSIKEG